MKLLYIGSGYDFKITKLFPTISNFIFVDVQPRNQFDDICCPNETKFERNYFMNYVLEAALKNNFELISKCVLKTYSDREIRNPTLCIFTSQTQTINFYISSNFRRDNLEELNKEIQECNGIIIKGYFHIIQ